MSSPQCVVIIAGLATAETADSQAVGTGRQREGGKEGMMMKGKEGDAKMKRRQGRRGWLLFC